MVDLARKDVAFGKRVLDDSATESSGDESERVPRTAKTRRRRGRVLPEKQVEVHGHQIGSVNDNGEILYKANHISNVLGRQISRPAGTYRVINGRIYVTKERLDSLFANIKSPERKVKIPQVKIEPGKRPRDDEIVDLTRDEPAIKKRVARPDDHYAELFKHLDPEQKRIMWAMLSKDLFKEE
jgi:uncharacterized protein YlzI (FlbEa/FlbD family)